MELTTEGIQCNFRSLSQLNVLLCARQSRTNVKCLNYTDSVLGSVKIMNHIIMVKIDRSVPYRIKIENVAVKFFRLAKSNLLQSCMALCPQVRSRASQHFQVASQLRWLLCPATVRSVISLRRVRITLRASLSGTFLQTLSELATSAKAHS